MDLHDNARHCRALEADAGHHAVIALRLKVSITKH